MPQAYAHEAILSLDRDADQKAPGAAVTLALCRHWEHQPPCPLAPHYVASQRVEDELHIPALFAAEPENVPEVRRRIEQALCGQGQFPDGFTTPRRLRHSRRIDVSPDEADHAERLKRG